jgi:hypothetical protein
MVVSNEFVALKCERAWNIFDVATALKIFAASGCPSLSALSANAMYRTLDSDPLVNIFIKLSTVFAILASPFSI